MTLAEIVSYEVKDPVVSLHILMRIKYEPSTCQYIARSDDGEILMAISDEVLHMSNTNSTHTIQK